MITQEDLAWYDSKIQSGGEMNPQDRAEIEQFIKATPDLYARYPDLAPSGVEGVGGALLTAGTSALAEPVSGWAGILTGLFTGDSEAAAQAVQSTQEALTYTPEGAAAGRLQQFGELPPVKGAVEGLEWASQEMGDIGMEGLGSLSGPTAAAYLSSIPQAGLEIAGAATGLKGMGVAADAADVAGSAKKLSAAIPQSQTKQKIAQLLQEGSTDKITAKYKLAEPDTIDGKKLLSASDTTHSIMKVGAPKVVKDPVATKAIKQGFDEGVVAMIKGASPEDKAAMLRMLNKMRRLRENALEGAMDRPESIVGQTLMNRVDRVIKKNKSAGKRLDAVAKDLRGNYNLDFESAVNPFLDDLADMRIKLVRNESGDIVPDFRGSDIEGLAGPEAAITRLVARMQLNGGTPDAYAAHQLKKYIDENVTYGGSGEGLKGKTERVLKKLRANIDAELDRNFPAYDKVNTQYADTVSALDALQDALGKKINLTGKNADKATGQLMRRLLSNTPSRIALYDAVDDIEAVARKYGGNYNDNVLAQALFSDELDKVFKPAARTSFENLATRQVNEAMQMTTQPGMAAAAMDKAGDVYKKVRGLTNEDAYKTLTELLKGDK